ncbi:type VI secretion system baseplate subunit TssF [Geomonas sp. Red32]|nr:type VI secretion system baseplate subunit TssF [Geomonas sp. Red32]
MTDRFFQQELALFHDLAAEFASAHPALAPLLDKDKNDADVERLLEGAVFQNSLLLQKLEGDFPALVHTLVQLILPHYLRPVPATTLIAYTPHPSQSCPVTVPAGTRFASAPVDGTPCLFTTTAAAEVHPVELVDATSARRTGRRGEIFLRFTMAGASQSGWHPKSLRLFLSGDHSTATDLFLLLTRHVSRILVAPLNGEGGVVLPSGSVIPAAFVDAEPVFPYPPHALPRYRLLQEYFSFPQRFLCLDVQGLDCWEPCRDFTVTFELDNITAWPRIKQENFIVNAVPAVNLFSQEAEPVLVTHRTSRYPIRPSGLNPGQYRIFSVDRVTGYTRSTWREREYFPFELFTGDHGTAPLYHAEADHSSHPDRHRTALCLSFPGGPPLPDDESLSISLTCTNGALPGKLRIGDIRGEAASLPEVVIGRNVTPISPGQDPPAGLALLRRLLSHLYLNYLPLESAERLRALLELYVFAADDGTRGTASLKRIAGIESVEVTAGERLVSGVVLRGREIRVKVRQDHFAGAGDMYLFGCVLDRFLVRSAPANCYTHFELLDTLTGASWQWQTQLATRPIH